MRTALVVVVLLVAGCVTGAGLGAEPTPTYTGPKVVLKPRYEPGKYVLSAATDTQQEAIPDGKASEPQTMTQVLVLALDVGRGDKDSNTPVEFTYRRIANSFLAPRTQERYDSDGPPEKQDPARLEVFAGLLRVRAHAGINPDGQTYEVTGPGEHFSRLAKTHPGMADKIAELRGLADDKIVGHLLSRDATFFSREAVGPGDVWHPKTTPTEGFEEADSHRECRLVDIEQTPTGNVAVVQMTGVEHAAKGRTIPLGKITMTMKKMENQATARVRFNIDRGYNESSELTQHSTMESDVVDEKGQPHTIVHKNVMKLTLQIVRESDLPRTGASAPKP